MVRRSTINGVVFEHIPVEDVRVAYERIEQDLHKIRKKSYADWIPADIYAALKNGKTELFIAYEKEHYVGFIITSLVRDSGGQPVLFLWAEDQDSKFKNRDNGLVFMSNLAEELKVSAIEFSSTRKGWTRAAKIHGYEPVTQIYRKEL